MISWSIHLWSLYMYNNDEVKYSRNNITQGRRDTIIIGVKSHDIHVEIPAKIVWKIE